MESINSKILEIADKLGQKPVFGQGKKNAEILLLGEAPGAKEVETGIPFAGSAGKNLNEFLEILHLSRKDIYITNTVKIRPSRINGKTGRTVNRPPTEAEIQLFSSALREEIFRIKPKIIVTLGNTALQGLLGKDKKIGSCHGMPLEWESFTLFPLYHPAAVIYRRSLREEYLADLEKLKNLLAAKM